MVKGLTQMGPSQLVISRYKQRYQIFYSFCVYLEGELSVARRPEGYEKVGRVME